MAPGLILDDLLEPVDDRGHLLRRRPIESFADAFHGERADGSPGCAWAGPAAVIPCQCHPKLVGQCFTVHGSLSLYRSAPTARISIIGTKRVLGLKEGVPEWLEEDLEEPGNAVLADFLVCPLTRAKRGTMQLVCVDAADNMVVTQKP